MSKSKDAKLLMLEHSKAKIKLYNRYLSIYLNILNRVDFIRHINLFDLFAGEGVYSGGGKGSAVAAAETIKDHYYSNNKKCTDITFTINEPEKSEVEKGVLKIDRIKREISKISLPPNLKLIYSTNDYNSIIKDVITDIDNLLNNERALLFVDPWGYKEINFDDLKLISSNEKSELLLFLPIYFMYRFAESVLRADTFPGGESLENLLQQIFQVHSPNLDDQELFIRSIKVALQKQGFSRYIDTFVIERKRGQLFCLFFFTNNQLGMRKMLESKWIEDEEKGHGFRLDANQGSLFSGLTFSRYPSDLENYFRVEKKLTNQEIFEFGLQHGHLPKHSNKIINSMKKKGVMQIKSLDESPIKGNYIGDNSRIIEFEYKPKGN